MATALGCSTSSGAYLQIAVLDELAQLGCDPSVKDSVSSTPLHVAAGEGHIQAILKLVELVSCTANLQTLQHLVTGALPSHLHQKEAGTSGTCMVLSYQPKGLQWSTGHPNKLSCINKDKTQQMVACMHMLILLLA